MNVILSIMHILLPQFYMWGCLLVTRKHVEDLRFSVGRSVRQNFSLVEKEKISPFPEVKKKRTKYTREREREKQVP